MTPEQQTQCLNDISGIRHDLVVLQTQHKAELKLVRKTALREAAQIGYIICAQTRHVTLGGQVEMAILNLQDKD